MSASLVAGGHDSLGDLGMLRRAEIAVEMARNALVAEAQVDGITWKQIGDVLCITAEFAEHRYGKNDS